MNKTAPLSNLACFAVILSCCLSLSALVLVLQIRRENAGDDGDRFKRGTVEDFEDTYLGCTVNGSLSLTSTNLGALNRRLNYLTCRYQGLHDQSERRSDEISAMMYVINDIAMNMNAAKAHILENQVKIRSLQNANDQTPPTNEPSELHLQESLGGGTDSIFSLNVKITKLQNKFRVINETLRMLSNRLNATVRHRLVEQDETRLNSEQEEVRAVTDEWRDEVKGKTRKNSMLIGSNKVSITKLEEKLANHASGWFNAPNGYQYFLSKNAFRVNSFIRSRRYCQNQGAELAYVGMRDPDIFRFLWTNLVGPSRNQCVWIGLTSRSGTWLWMDDKNVGLFWRNWATTVQQQHIHSDQCGIIRAGMWNGASCNGPRKLCSFLCERKVF